MPRLGLSRLRPLRKLLLTSTASSLSQAAAASSSLPYSNFHHRSALSLPHETRLRFVLGSANGSSVSVPFNSCRTFSVARMEMSGSGSVVATGEEEIESDDVSEAAADFRSGVVSDDEQVSLELVEEADMFPDSSEEELFSCVRTFSHL